MKPHHGASGTPAKFAGYQADFPGLGRGLRGPITPVFGFAQ